MVPMNDYVVISPVRDEENHITFTLQSVISQTITPLEWVIVDDGSTDNTSGIVEQFAKQYSWIRLLHRKDRGYRKSGAGVIEAFHEGYALLRSQHWDYLVKLDGDLSFAPDYFEECFKSFVAEVELGIGGGTICQLENGQLKVDSAGDPPFHVRGATKIYRRACWEDIKPLIQAPGWDTIDEIKANLHGWTTRTFSNLKLIQHKPTGGADGRWRNWFKNGRANYITGYHPLFMMLKCLKRALHRPLLLGSIALWTGYCSGYIRRIPQLSDKDVIHYLRQQQLRRLLLLPSIYD